MPAQVRWLLELLLAEVAQVILDVAADQNVDDVLPEKLNALVRPNCLTSTLTLASGPTGSQTLDSFSLLKTKGQFHESKLKSKIPPGRIPLNFN